MQAEKPKYIYEETTTLKGGKSGKEKRKIRSVEGEVINKKDGLKFIFENYLRPTLELIEKAAREKLKTNFIMTSGQY